MTVERKRIIAGVLLLALLIAAVAAIVWRREPPESAAERPFVAESAPPDHTTPPDVTDDPVPPESTSTISATAPASSASNSSGSGSNNDDDDSDDDDSDTPSKPKPPGETAAEKEWREYLETTKEIVTENAPALDAQVGEAAEALASGNVAALAQLYAVDENAGSTDAQEAIGRYPLILSVQPASTVNIYTVNQATVYFTYTVVKWEDAGIISEHTIAIPMRFINGAWRVSTIDERTSGLTFVQSVQL